MINIMRTSSLGWHIIKAGRNELLVERANDFFDM